MEAFVIYWSKASETQPVEVAKWAFKGYGFRWKIEEYHRHVKQEYNLEAIQIKTFTGLQSIPGIANHSNAHDIQENCSLSTWTYCWIPVIIIW